MTIYFLKSIDEFKNILQLTFELDKDNKDKGQHSNFNQDTKICILNNVVLLYCSLNEQKSWISVWPTDRILKIT